MRRRDVLAGLTAATAMPALPSWAEIGPVAYLSAVSTLDGGHFIVGLDAVGEALFETPLDGRAHAAAVHPSLARAVVCARRPGRVLDVIDCATGRRLRTLPAPDGHHFYGHAVFDDQGHRLYTTENAYRTGEGRIGIWSMDGFRRVGSVSSGGIGPHDIALSQDGLSLIVANGGIRTHPDTGREKLNLPTMQPKLSFIDLGSGRIWSSVEPPAELRQNSMRHLAVGPDGTVAVACQWQGEVPDVPLLALLPPDGDRLTFHEADPLTQLRTGGYAGSVSFDAAGEHVAITCPRGNLGLIYSVAQDAFVETWSQHDVCGVAAAATGFVATDGYGSLAFVDTASAQIPAGKRYRQWSFDNHLVQLRQPGAG
ncbi:MAG: DUF1513 domain-containing protein [Pseudomonadota bacterium]